MRIRRLLTALSASALAAALSVNCYASTWARAYGGTLEDRAHAVAPSRDGFLVAGETRSFGAGGSDAWILKLDADGNVLWELTYGGPGEDRALSARATLDGGYVVAGETEFPGMERQAWVLRADEQGSVLWQSVYGDPTGNATAHDIALTDLGGFLLAGSKGPDSQTPAPHCWMLDLRQNGSVHRDFGCADAAYAAGGSVLEALAETTDRGWIGAGNTIAGPYLSGFWLMKLSVAGRMDWTSGHASGFPSKAYSVHELSSGGYAALGVWGGNNPNAPQLDMLAVRVNALGEEIWKRTYGGAGEEVGYAIREANGLVLAGQTSFTGAGNLDAWLLKTDYSGNILWQRTYGGVLADTVQSLEVLPDGGLILAGYTSSFGSGDRDAWVLKLDAEGLLHGPCALARESNLASRTAGMPGTVGEGWRLPDLTTAIRENLAVGEASSSAVEDACGLPPNEVSPPGAAEPLRFLSKTMLVWEEASRSGSTTFNLYRGLIPSLQLGYGTCLQRAIGVNGTVDAELPVAGGFFYIVTGRNAFGEGPMGSRSDGMLRQNANPCP